MIGPRNGTLINRSNTTQRQNKQSGDTTSEGIGRLGRFGTAMKDSSKDNAITKLQSFAAAEGERQKKKKADDEAAAKKKSSSTAPEQGFFSRMYDKYIGGKKEGQ